MIASNDLRRRLLGTTGLAILAIFAVLFMHGLDPAAIGFGDRGHHVANQEPDAAITGHGMLGLCMFAIGLVGLVTVSVSHRRHRSLPRPPRRGHLPNLTHHGAVAGRYRLMDLGVIRV